MARIEEDLKSIFYIGLGAASVAGKEATKIKEDLIAKGKYLYEQGNIVNEELKHNIEQTIKKHTEVSGLSKEEILKNINELSKEDREELLKELNK